MIVRFQNIGLLRPDSIFFVSGFLFGAAVQDQNDLDVITLHFFSRKPRPTINLSSAFANPNLVIFLFFALTSWKDLIRKLCSVGLSWIGQQQNVDLFNSILAIALQTYILVFRNWWENSNKLCFLSFLYVPYVIFGQFLVKLSMDIIFW